MAKVFENLTNGHRETVSGASGVLAVMFGFFYFAAKGLWRHVVIQLAIIILSFGALGAPGTMIVILMWVIYGFFATSILEARYLRDGWKEVSESSPQDQPSWKTASPQQSDERPCPFCAESIKKAAVKCRHCHSEVTAIAVEPPPDTPAQLFAPRVLGKMPLADGDMECKNCNKHIPKDAFSCAFCGHRYQA